MMVLFVLLFVVIWIFDLHKSIYIKSVSRNAGDSAALMAARWQGKTLNLVGDLNIMQAMALSTGDTNTCTAINNMQARLCYVGPMIALMAAQQAGKNNGIFPNPDFDALLGEHAAEVRFDYPAQTAPDGTILFPEPYPECWNEYANMLDLIAKDGVVAGPDNAHFYGDSTGGHTLLDIGFYDAVAGRSWCWFFNNAPSLLTDYQNFFPCWWPALPDPPHQTYMNSEIFGLGLEKQVSSLSAFTDEDTITTIAEERQLPGSMTSTGMTLSATWYIYGSSWTTWNIMNDRSFPLTGSLKPQYNYVGADAAIRIEADIQRLMPARNGTGLVSRVTWTAAAKPFGYLNEDQRPDSCGLVIPAFHAVRLIPIDASTAPSGGSYNIGWRRHLSYHLPEYMERGLEGLTAGCYYCQQLQTWEDQAFRQYGVTWLSSNSWQCTISVGGGGGGSGGGTRRGH